MTPNMRFLDCTRSLVTCPRKMPERQNRSVCRAICSPRKPDEAAAQRNLQPRTPSACLRDTAHCVCECWSRDFKMNLPKWLLRQLQQTLNRSFVQIGTVQASRSYCSLGEGSLAKRLVGCHIKSFSSSMRKRCDWHNSHQELAATLRPSKYTGFHLFARRHTVGAVIFLIVTLMVEGEPSAPIDMQRCNCNE